MIRYSVVIPHYNVPDLLVRCLESIPVRDDIQVIVVDDHSPGSETFKERYPILGRPGLTFVVSPEHIGGGHARNMGLDLSEGQWIVFSDADDLFLEGAFDVLDKYSGSDADVIYFPSVIEVEGDWNPGSRLEWLNDMLTLYKEKGDDRPLRCLHVVPWSKMIKRDLVEKLGARFDEIVCSDDVMFSVKIGIGAPKISVADEPIYRNFIRRGTVSHPMKWNSYLMTTRAETAMRANKMTEGNYSQEYSDAYISLAKLFFIDIKSFFKLCSKAREHYVSLPKVYWRVFLRGLWKAYHTIARIFKW